MKEIFETLRKQIKGGFDQNNIIIILDNSISLTCKKHPIPGTNNSIFIIQPYLIDTIFRPINSGTMDIPNQLYDYLEQIELFPFQGYSTTYQELEYNYNYHIRYRTQRLKIQNQIEQESQQLIKNLILSNQINQITPTQIKIQF